MAGSGALPQMEDLPHISALRPDIPRGVCRAAGRLDKLRAFLAAQDPATLAPDVEAEVRELIADTEEKLAEAGSRSGVSNAFRSRYDQRLARRRSRR